MEEPLHQHLTLKHRVAVHVQGPVDHRVAVARIHGQLRVAGVADPHVIGDVELAVEQDGRHAPGARQPDDVSVAGDADVIIRKSHRLNVHVLARRHQLDVPVGTRDGEARAPRVRPRRRRLGHDQVSVQRRVLVDVERLAHRRGPVDLDGARGSNAHHSCGRRGPDRGAPGSEHQVTVRLPRIARLLVRDHRRGLVLRRGTDVSEPYVLEGVGLVGLHADLQVRL